jgi:hypothetical protein
MVEERRGRSKARCKKWRTGHGTQDLHDAKLLPFSNTPGTAQTKAPSTPLDTGPSTASKDGSFKTLLQHL